MKNNKQQSSLASFLPEPIEDFITSVLPFSLQNRGKSRELSESAAAKHLSALTITESVLREIYLTIGSRPAESGGPLGGSRVSGVVTHFHFDRSAARTGVTYSPDHQFLNQLFAVD